LLVGTSSRERHGGDEIDDDAVSDVREYRSIDRSG
jgi:hypothetical protein